MFNVTGFLPNISLPNCLVEKNILCLSNHLPYEEGYEVYFKTINKISKHNLKATSARCLGYAHDILRNKSNFCGKIY